MKLNYEVMRKKPLASYVISLPSDMKKQFIKEERVTRKRKKVYACQICNTYMTKDADEPSPLCCSRGMLAMDELDEDEIYEQKDAAGGL